MLVPQNWLLHLTLEPKCNQTRMQLDELHKLSLFQIFSYLRVTELAAVLLTSKHLANTVREYLRECPIQLLKEDSLRMGHRRHVALLEAVPQQPRVELSCLNVRLGQLMGCLRPNIQVLKLLWLDERQVFRQQFWQSLLPLGESLRKLTLSLLRVSQEQIESEQRASAASLTLFFDQMKCLEKFSYKLGNGLSESTRFDFARYAQLYMSIHTRVVLGVLSSNTLKRLTLRNVILMQTTLANWPASPIEQVKVEYDGDHPELVLNQNSLRLRLGSSTFFFLLKCFPMAKKLAIHDWSSLENKFLCEECIKMLHEHITRLGQPMQLIINSYVWHWQLSKLNLFQLCEMPFNGPLLSLRSLYSLDADAINLVAQANAWKVGGLDLSFSNINDQCLEVLAATYKDMHIFGISGCKKLSREALLEYLKELTSLQEFYAEQTVGFTSSCLQELVEANHQTLNTLKLKKNKVSGDAISDCLRKCTHLTSLSLRNMNNLYDDFHFRWISGLNAQHWRSNCLIQLDISNNERFDRKLLKRLRKLFPCLTTLKLINTVDLLQKDRLVHPNVEYLTVLVDTSKASRYKETCLDAFPSLLILHTSLKEKVKSGMRSLRPQQFERRLIVYDQDDEVFVL